MKGINYLYILKLILVLFFINNLNAQNGKWQKFDSLFNPGAFEEIKCADSLNCFIYSRLADLDGGYVFTRTTDGGNTWENTLSDSNHWINSQDFYWAPKIRSIAYPNTKLFIAVGDSGVIIRTTDKGETWQKNILDKNKKLFDVIMLDNSYGLLLGSLENNFKISFLFKTNDGGITWDSMKTSGIGMINIINPNLLCGLTQRINKDSVFENLLIWVHNNWESSDTIILPAFTNYANQLCFINSNQGWIAGGQLIYDTLENGIIGYHYTQQIFHTSDGGHTWDTQRDTAFNNTPIQEIKFYDENFGMASSQESNIAVTTDGGKHWKDDTLLQNLPPHTYWYVVLSIQIPNNHTAFVIVEFSDIYKYTGNYPTTEVNEKPPGNDFVLYPNPVTDILHLPDLNTIYPVKIYSSAGIKVIESEYKEKLDISGLSPGIYFVQCGNWNGKFVLVK